MERAHLLDLLSAVGRGDLTPAEAAERLASLVGPVGGAVAGAGGGPAVAHVDHHRAVRCGFPEVVYGPGKTPDDLVRIAREILTRSDRLLVTRVEGEPLTRLLAAVPDAVHHARARAVTVRRGARGEGRPGIVIVSAGTADIPVAEEARVTAEALGEAPVVIYDVGVAGLHRLLARHGDLRRARVVIVVAGMEGALASVVGGLVEVPVIAVPTSVGYGAAFNGLAATLGMLTSCASGITVCNIDNGFGAAFAAGRILRTRKKAK